jgi:hypothetical protein
VDPSHCPATGYRCGSNKLRNRSGHCAGNQRSLIVGLDLGTGGFSCTQAVGFTASQKIVHAMQGFQIRSHRQEIRAIRAAADFECIDAGLHVVGDIAHGFKPRHAGATFKRVQGTLHFAGGCKITRIALPCVKALLQCFQ